jgi:outer membrane protein OmpA-like peptidoglycan-associated protein
VTSRSARTEALVAIAILLVAAPARADFPGFAVDRFEPAERGSRWFVVDSLDLRETTRPALGLTLDHAYKSLAVYDAAGNERAALVRHQALLHAGASLVLADRVRVGVNVPFAVYQDGEPVVVEGYELRPATAPAFGDVRLAADVRLLGVHGDPFTLAAGVRGWMPTGMRSQFTSDGTFRGEPQLLAAGTIGVFEWAARAGVMLRPRDERYAGSPLGTEIEGAVGVGARIGRVLVGPEIFAASGVEAFLSEHRTPTNAILGAHYTAPSGLAFGAAIGTGLPGGFGAPALRGLATIEWSRPVPPPPPDRDHDGVPDATDACPDVPGVHSSDPDVDGCPPPERVPREDTDGDGIFDDEDACPGLRGVPSNDPMTNGCPPEAPRQLAVLTTKEIKIGEEVQFATNSADLVGESDAVLSAVKKVLDEHPEIRKVRVEGHTDDTGDPAYNDDLSKRRAASVVRWLVDHGVAAERLASEGYGARQPIAPNDTEAGRSKNRRVAFTVTERAPKK